MPEVIPFWAQMVLAVGLVAVLFLPRIVYRLTRPGAKGGPLPLLEEGRRRLHKFHRPQWPVFWRHFGVWVLAFAGLVGAVAFVLVPYPWGGVLVAYMLLASRDWLAMLFGMDQAFRDTWLALLLTGVFWGLLPVLCAVVTSSLAAPRRTQDAPD
ncbi:hypothetical protein [Azospira restricta]|uniref:Transmembrane protein n=1 Tax=Azospira restricta TaxID=404405 RepID=A0A974SQC3_9RHOO|nr:hypothetical protein [Azospira restricta]QRJ64502.1 hypothetical protein IWH25_03880 [Azospira restricta]